MASPHRAFIPFRIKLLLGVLAIGGVMLGFMTFLLHTAVRAGMVETLTSSMATAAAGMTPGLEAAAGDALARSAGGQPGPADLAQLRTWLNAMRTRMIREFPTDWLIDAGLVRQPDLLIVMRDGAGQARVIAATQESLEGRSYNVIPDAASDGGDPWEHLSYDTAAIDAHTPGPPRTSGEAERAPQPTGAAMPSRFGGRSPIRLGDGRAVGLLVVDADVRLISSVTENFKVGAAILFAFVLSVLVVFAYVLAWWFNRPVRMLDKGMARVAAGDFSVQIPSPNRRDEFDGVVERFNTMVRGLQDREKMRTALDLASEVQRHLLPARLPEIAGYELVHAVHYSEETGGDALDCFSLPRALGREAGPRGGDQQSSAEGLARWAISVGDVSGHGIAAAMLMSWIRGTLRARAEELGDRPDLLLDAINHHFFRDSPTGKFLTFFYGVLDPLAHELRWSSAGHEPAILIGRAGVRRLGSTGVPLGVLEQPGFKAGEPMTLAPGDLLYIGTDGVSECRAPSGELLGRKRLEDALVGLRGKPIAGIRDGLLELIAAHRSSAPQNDDLTFMLLRRKG